MGRQRRDESELQNARRMEAIGQLTAGVAHDFNNLLCSVIGNLELFMARNAGPETPAAARILAEALKAAEHGAELTQQLLSFARRQTLARSHHKRQRTTYRGTDGLHDSPVEGRLTSGFFEIPQIPC